MFPSEAVPDGHVAAPHHVYLGVLMVLLAVWMVSDDHPGREPWLVGAAVLVAVGAFGLTWRWYPAVGAALTLLSLCVALAALCGRPYWAAYSWVGFRGAALLGVLVALDDALEHAFGWPMPLDLFWKHWLYGVVSSF
jgi:hypothetical protein